MQKFNVLRSDINLYELRRPFEDIVGLLIITVSTSLLFISSCCEIFLFSANVSFEYTLKTLFGYL